MGRPSWPEESKKAKRPGLRLFQVARAVASTPQADCGSNLRQVLQPKDADGLIPEAGRGWQVCTRDTAPLFPAVPYYFAAALQEKLDVPVGLGAPIVGGTAIESWMSLEALHTIPAYRMRLWVRSIPFLLGRGARPACTTA